MRFYLTSPALVEIQLRNYFQGSSMAFATQTTSIPPKTHFISEQLASSVSSLMCFYESQFGQLSGPKTRRLLGDIFRGLESDGLQ